MRTFRKFSHNTDKHFLDRMVCSSILAAQSIKVSCFWLNITSPLLFKPIILFYTVLYYLFQKQSKPHDSQKIEKNKRKLECVISTKRQLLLIFASHCAASQPLSCLCTYKQPCIGEPSHTMWSGHMERGNTVQGLRAGALGSAKAAFKAQFHHLLSGDLNLSAPQFLHL